jgi:hypothetical protein
MRFVRIALGTVLLIGAMLLPFLPGRYDPLAADLSLAATVVAFVSLLLVPLGAAWLVSGRGYALARVALVTAGLVAAAAALAMAATGSAAAAVVFGAACMVWIVRHWRRVGAARTSGERLPLTVPVALILVPLVATALRMTLVESAAVWGRDRAIANATAIITDIERFRQRTGTYPVAINSVVPDYLPGIIGVERYRYEPNRDAYNLYFEYPPTDVGAREIVMYNPRGEQDFSSHAVDLLELSPEEIRRQRGYFASHVLPQANWKRFLFD